MAPAARPAADAHNNQLLAALPEPHLQRWRALLQPVRLQRGQVVYESGATIGQAWFPTSAIVSLQHVTENGSTIEIAVVGKDGMVGIPLFMGGGSTPGRAVVQSAGEAWCMAGAALRAEFLHTAPVMLVLLRYTQALIAQMTQTAVCNRHHALGQQLSRWLLQRLDRHASGPLQATQEQIASLLGVRREGVTEAALALQHEGIIRYQRGRIWVLDRTALEQRSCECYAVVQAEYKRLLPGD